MCSLPHSICKHHSIKPRRRKRARRDLSLEMTNEISLEKKRCLAFIDTHGSSSICSCLSDFWSCGTYGRPMSPRVERKVCVTACDKPIVAGRAIIVRSSILPTCFIYCTQLNSLFKFASLKSWDRWGGQRLFVSLTFRISRKKKGCCITLDCIWNVRLAF